MLRFRDYFIVEGGAAGHMAHPFDLHDVNTGKDLITFFDKAFKYVQNHGASLKIDGLNVSIKLVNSGALNNAHWEFALDRGSMKPLDVKGITIKDLESRFGAGHGMIAAGEKTLSIMNAALPHIVTELQSLNFFQNGNLFFNTEFVQGRTNVLSYDQDFLAIHGVNQFEQVTPNRRASVEVDYNKKALQSLIEKTNKIAQQHNFKILGSVDVSSSGVPKYNEVLNQPFTIVIKGEKTSDSLNDRLLQATNPRDTKIRLKNGKSVGALSKEVYIALLNGTPVDELVVNPQDYQKAIDGAVIYHATRALGAQLLGTLKSEMGNADQHEGIVIRDPSISSNPVKVTGNFIVKGLESKFGKDEGEEEASEDEINSPYQAMQKRSIFNTPPNYGMGEGQFLTPKPATFSEMVDMAIGTERGAHKKFVVIYPGRFQPFHLGHAKVYNELQQQFPTAEVFIATSDKTDESSPFTFDEKQNLILATGIGPQMVIKSAEPYKAIELVNKYDKTNTVLIIAVGEKDMQGPKPRFQFKRKLNGDLPYFQPFKSLDECEPLSKHAYITTQPNHTFTVGNSEVKSASQIRDSYKNASDSQRRQIIADLYGHYKPQIHTLFNQKLG